ncbi:EAL domain-containing protein [Vulcanococcus limneticus]|uniref:sensor domain-containing protein n=1 Tax=Vulcanococcus limneticus TaxID=2170428 RepID=UPI00398BCAC4
MRPVLLGFLALPGALAGQAMPKQDISRRSLTPLPPPPERQGPVSAAQGQANLAPPGAVPLIGGLALLCAGLLGWNAQLRRHLRHSEQELRHSETQALATLRAVPDLLFELDRQGRYLTVQALDPQQLVAKRELLIGRSVHDVMPPAAAATCLEALAEADRRGSARGHQILLPLPEGERWFEVSMAKKPGGPGAPDTYVVISRDIHERKLALEELQRQIRFYTILSRCNDAILASRSEAELMQRICDEAISTGVLRMAWIGLVDPACGRVKPLAWAGVGTDYLTDIQISVAADSPYGQGPTGSAIRDDRPFWCQDYQHDPATAPWHRRGELFGWKASASLPLHRGGANIGALTLYASEANAFTASVQRLLLDMATDLELALDRFAYEAEQGQLREAVLQSERQYRELTETINDVVWRIEAESLGPLYFSPSVQQLWGYAPEEVLQGLPLRAFGPRFRLWRQQRQLDYGHWQERGHGASPISLPLEEIELRRRDGTAVWVESSISLVPQGSSGRPEFHGVSRDITSRKQAEQEVERLAHFDQLTGLANRDLLNQEFQFVLSSCLREQQPVAVMLLNLDHFQVINDSLGSEAGDRLLVETAQRLRRTLRSSDVIARVGGDEFLIVLPKLTPRDAAIVATTLQAAVAEAWHDDGHEVVVTASVGIAMAPEDSRDRDLLARKASLALHDVKQEQPNGYRFFTDELQARTARTMQLSNALRFALERDEFRVVYQPQVDTTTGAVLGAEALLRWQHPELGPISPAEFIPVAERNGLILPIGSWVLAEAIHQLQRWIDAGLAPPRIAVNLSALQFRQADLAERTATLLAGAGVPADLLELELTETATMENPAAARHTIHQLGLLGIRFAIDDFGTGYSSLSNLRQLKAYKLKIDASFIRDLNVNADARAIVTGIVNMARGMGIRTLAEGVECLTERRFLQQQGCDEIQGYLFAKPLPPEEFMAYTQRERAGAATVAVQRNQERTG